MPNRLFARCLEEEGLPPFRGYPSWRAEVRWGQCRVDFLLEAPGRPPCLVETKSCNLVEDGLALFPDAPTTRGTRHLLELAAAVQQGLPGRGGMVCAAGRRGGPGAPPGGGSGFCPRAGPRPVGRRRSLRLPLPGRPRGVRCWAHSRAGSTLGGLARQERTPCAASVAEGAGRVGPQSMPARQSRIACGQSTPCGVLPSSAWCFTMPCGT